MWKQRQADPNPLATEWTSIKLQRVNSSTGSTEGNAHLSEDHEKTKDKLCCHAIDSITLHRQLGWTSSRVDVQMMGLWWRSTVMPEVKSFGW